MTAEVQAAILEIINRSPVNLDTKFEYTVKDVGIREIGYTDNHEFLIMVPAWVLRVLKSEVIHVPSDRGDRRSGEVNSGGPAPVPVGIKPHTCSDST